MDVFMAITGAVIGVTVLYYLFLLVALIVSDKGATLGFIVVVSVIAAIVFAVVAHMQGK